MHYIQKQILDSLRIAAQPVRYAQLNSQQVESGHFRYHLLQLVKAGLVDQVSRGTYSLSLQGQAQVDKLSAGRVNAKSMPKVITYTLLQHGDTYFLQRKTKQPYINLLNMIGGKVHEGESTQAASVREVHEKTGLDIDVPVLRGIFEIRISSHANLLSHVIAYVYSAECTPEQANASGLVSVSSTTVALQPDLAPDLVPMLEHMSKGSIATAELSIQFS